MPSLNKKIKNATQITTDGLVFKSKLEATVYKELVDEGFTPKYEATKHIIWKGGRPTIPFFNKDKKTGLLKRDTKPLQPITYTPDFEFEYDGTLFIIEVKGLENDVFPIKKKMFRKYLETLTHPVVYFEIYSKRQIIEAIKIIKAMNKITEIRQFFIHLPEKDRKLAEGFLDKRKFVELKEIVDSDVKKFENKNRTKLLDFDPNEEPSPEFLELETKYEELKRLQAIVTEQALPFLDEDYLNTEDDETEFETYV